jgi:hypothetical protein
MIGGSQDHTLTIYIAIHPLAYHLMMLAVMVMATTLLPKSLYHDANSYLTQTDCLGLREIFSPSSLLDQMLYNMAWLLAREDSPVLYRTGALYDHQIGKHSYATQAICLLAIAHQVAFRINNVHYLVTSSLSHLRTNRQKAQ